MFDDFCRIRVLDFSFPSQLVYNLYHNGKLSFPVYLNRKILHLDCAVLLKVEKLIRECFVWKLVQMVDVIHCSFKYWNKYRGIYQVHLCLQSC